MLPSPPAAVSRFVSGCVLASFLAGAAPLHAASLFDPALRFRAIRTEHFIIYFHQGAEPPARKLAAIAEQTWTALSQPFRVAPPARTHVVLVDQSELANGYATPVPYDTIVIATAWPAGYEFIGNADDWLQLVFTHEFTHIVHLDRSEGWARLFRRVLGRTPVAFPNLYLPIWQIEGLATFEESALTDAGRLHAGDFTAVLAEAARHRALEPLDRVNGGLTDWPAGNAAYAYGLGFHQYLADRFGPASLADLAQATARRVPFTASPVFKRIYGQPLGALWKDYERSLIDHSSPAPAGEAAAQLTHHGFVVSGPRVDRFVCDGCPLPVVYSVRTPHGFPSLNCLSLDGAARTAARSEPRQLTTRYLGSTTAIGREELYFDQQEIRRNVALYSDLYALSRATGRVRRLTSGARLLDPDLSPDGRSLVAVQDRAGQRNLVLVRLKPDSTEKPDVAGSAGSGFSRTRTRTPAIDTLIAQPETQFNSPRWSPDGRSIAVEWHQPGGLSQIAIVDVATKALRPLTSFGGVRVVTPAWRPDGRAVVAAAAGRDQPFNLYEVPIDNPMSWRPLTHTTGGALWPDVSPDGKTIVFAGYTVAGFDLFSIPYAPAGEPSIPAGGILNSTTRWADLEPVPTAAATYSPWPTLRPTSWTPIVEGDSTQLRFGAAAGGVDVLGYHSYAASATWLISGPAQAELPSAAAPDWSVTYAYDRWRPTLWAAASSATSFFSGPPTASGTPSNLTQRERTMEAGVLVPIRHVRVSHVATVSVLSAVDEYTRPGLSLSIDRRALRGAWATTSARTYGYSISPEDGVTIGTTAEQVPRRLGSSADASAYTVDARAYLPGIGRHHVVAVRAASGVSTGNIDVRRTFHLGGAVPNTSVIDSGRNAISLLRGFSSDTFAGSHVALINADYRWPIVRPQRGAGTWPIMLHTVHAAAFIDAGHAWTETFRAAGVKTSIGGELSADIVAGYFFRFTSAVGAAWGHDGAGTVRDRTTVYLRAGRAF